MKRGWMIAVLTAANTACAVGAGGGSPVEYTMVAVDAGQASAADIAAQVQQASGDFALVSAPRDSAWFAQLATTTQLGLSGPARAGDLGLAFLSRLELLGDTAITLGSGAGQFTAQDALYEVEGERFLDLMLVRLPAGADVQAAARALLEYMATDVMANASLVLGIQAETAADAQAMEELLRAAFRNAAECGATEAAESRFRIFFGPAARIRCQEARRLSGAGAAVAARLSVGLQQ